MKKVLLAVIAVCGISLSVHAGGMKSGYRGFVDFSWTGYSQSITSYKWHENHYGVSTVHGYQIGPRYFVGMGFEIGRNSYLSSWYIPVFADFRADLQLGRFTPFVDCRVGWTFCDDGGFRFQPMLGYRFNFGHKFGINVGVGCTLQSYKVYSTGYYDGDYGTGSGEYVYGVSRSTRTVAGFVARVGFDF